VTQNQNQNHHRHQNHRRASNPLKGLGQPQQQWWSSCWRSRSGVGLLLARTWRDPDNFRARWRAVRAELGVPDATSHSFRKTVATLIDDEGLSARIGADHLGHSRISMTQDEYMARGRVHTAVADMLDRTINDE
jgi:integrase